MQTSVKIARPPVATHCAYPPRDGQAELTWVHGRLLRTEMVYLSKCSHRSKDNSRWPLHHSRYEADMHIPITNNIYEFTKQLNLMNSYSLLALWRMSLFEDVPMIVKMTRRIAEDACETVAIISAAAAAGPVQLMQGLTGCSPAVHASPFIDPLLPSLSSSDHGLQTDSQSVSPYIHRGPIKTCHITFVSIVTKYWPILICFSRHTAREICNKVVIRYPSTPLLRRYTTLWNKNFRRSLQCVWIYMQKLIVWNNFLIVLLVKLNYV